ncbi:MAG: zf-TFIIB domain-containing protein [Planctomycetaceae bacterium]|jgi:uncharacterized protein|nr:zf-TFIIB domain-containing protein [Planctomycetaceae bacterium]MBT6154151.1 zf-TFIIB domain-containing protein [Planctomycetaceae bacterium]MBT6487852.1 zf-TFIIB domain-containing protein [Planctomycetaceae bacterium]MBT6495686.1 zf-TFIIB domain-containing protein [Planctomycetaceae bacterium]
MNCPACKQSDLQERTLKNRLVIDNCQSCRGIWLDGGELQRLTKDPSAANRAIKVLLSDAVPTDRDCPRCHVSMVTVEFSDPAIDLDYCKDCCGLWFDAGELKKVVKLIQQKSVPQNQMGCNEQCPGCGTQCPASAALCIDCGYDFRSGGVRQTESVRELMVGGDKFEIKVRGDKILLRVPKRHRKVGWLKRSSGTLDLNLYSAVFTDHDEKTERHGRNGPVYVRDFYELRLMKLSWRETVRLTFHSLDESANDEFRELITFLKESAQHLEVLRSPPARYWGDDKRKWWQQWDFGFRYWKRVLAALISLGLILLWLTCLLFGQES